MKTYNFSRIDDATLKIDFFEKDKFYFSDFGINEKEFKRKYNNDWDELKEYVGLNDIELIDNELIIINLNYKAEPVKVYAVNYNVLRIMSGMG